MSSSRLRLATPDDAEAIADLFNAAFGDARPTSAADIRQWLANPGRDPADARVLAKEGRLVGYADVWREDDTLGADVAAPGFGDELLAWAEKRARELGLKKVRVWFPADNELAAVAGTRSYRYWRSALTLETNLEERPSTDLPTRPFGPGDEDVLRAAINEVFADDPFFHEHSPQEFASAYLTAPGAEPGLWLLAEEGTELAGFVLPYPRRGSDETLGWVSSLGVREPWRGRGLGRGLLLAAFAALYDRGLRRVGLGVDAENQTGALTLYESVGMRQVSRSDNWVKTL
jgi:ribosomal protein S18 acetylase RimI-like enzyme